MSTGQEEFEGQSYDGKTVWHTIREAYSSFPIKEGSNRIEWFDSQSLRGRTLVVAEQGSQALETFARYKECVIRKGPRLLSLHILVKVEQSISFYCAIFCVAFLIQVLSTQFEFVSLSLQSEATIMKYFQRVSFVSEETERVNNRLIVRCN